MQTVTYRWVKALTVVMLFGAGFYGCDSPTGRASSERFRGASKQQKSIGKLAKSELAALTRLTASWSPLKMGASTGPGEKFTGEISREELDALKKYGFLLAVLGNEHSKGESAYKKFLSTLRAHKVRTCLHEPGAQALIENYLTSSRERPNAKEHERFARALFKQIDGSEYEQDRQKVAYLYMGFWLGSAMIKAGSHETTGMTKMGKRLVAGLRRGNPPDDFDREHADQLENVIGLLGKSSPRASKIREAVARVLAPKAGV